MDTLLIIILLGFGALVLTNGLRSMPQEPQIIYVQPEAQHQPILGCLPIIILVFIIVVVASLILQ
jgi:uncharacterized membrane protein YidH (DUF202 family)